MAVTRPDLFRVIILAANNNPVINEKIISETLYNYIFSIKTLAHHGRIIIIKRNKGDNNIKIIREFRC